MNQKKHGPGDVALARDDGADQSDSGLARYEKVIPDARWSALTALAAACGCPLADDAERVSPEEANALTEALEEGLIEVVRLISFCRKGPFVIVRHPR